MALRHTPLLRRRPLVWTPLSALVVLAACLDSEADSPTALVPNDPLPIVRGAYVDDPPPPCDDYPALVGAGRVFTYQELAWPGLDGYDDRDGSALGFASQSRYVLYDDDTFSLQTCGDGSVSLDGTYAESGGSLAFHWYANSEIPADYPYPAERWPGPWEAAGTISDGDTLVVQYNLRMWLEGFLNARYVLAAVAP